MNKVRTVWAISGALATALILSACASGSPSGMEGHDMGATSSATAGDFNEQDVTFARMMIPHHEQAIDMAETVLEKKGVDPAVVDLAEQIQAAQGPEIETMSSWLEEWGAESGDGDHGTHGDGMMSDEDMAALGSAEGEEASRLFLEQMIVHHEGAIEMAEEEIESGRNPDAIALAGKIAADQQAEIETMRGLLSTL